MNWAPPESGGDSDAALMAQAGEGDRVAWHALYVRHKDRVFAVARRYLGDEMAARDVVQDVFISVFTHARTYRPSTSFGSFLRRVTVNRCINTRAAAFESRRERRDPERLLDVPDASPDPERRLEQVEAAEAVRTALAALPPRQRMAVVLSRFEGLSYQEIAGALDCSVSSVESLLFRARQALARSLAGKNART